jgi:hypothetical protein
MENRGLRKTLCAALGNGRTIFEPQKREGRYAPAQRDRKKYIVRMICAPYSSYPWRRTQGAWRFGGSNTFPLTLYCIKFSISMRKTVAVRTLRASFLFVQARSALCVFAAKLLHLSRPCFCFSFYFSSWRTFCGCWLAWASIACAACCRTLVFW